VFPLLNSEF
jgi:hypothetical protein